MPGCPIVVDGRVDFLEHLAFHHHIDLQVNVGGVDVCVPQPVADHVDLVAGAQQVHRSGMAQGVGSHGFGLERWTLMCGYGRILADDITDAEARNRRAIGIQEQRLGIRLCGAA